MRKNGRLRELQEANNEQDAQRYREIYEEIIRERETYRRQRRPVTHEQHEQIQEQQTSGEQDSNEAQVRARESQARELRNIQDWQEQARRESIARQRERVARRAWQERRRIREEREREQEQGTTSDEERPPPGAEGGYDWQTGDIVTFNERGGVPLARGDLSGPRGTITGFTTIYVRIRKANGEVINRAYRNVNFVRRPTRDERERYNRRWRNPYT